MQIDCKVAQGSIIAPLLLVHYINDLITASKVLRYAFEGLYRFGADSLAPMFWLRRFGAGVLVPAFWKLDVLALMFWRRYILVPTFFAPIHFVPRRFGAAFI